MNESVKRLEEKIAYLERHVVEQDKAMLELAGDLARLRKEVQKLRERLAPAQAGEGDASPTDERPPH
ncbi:MAG: SlyX family protein, partial [Pseudomonadota bacterium]